MSDASLLSIAVLLAGALILFALLVRRGTASAARALRGELERIERAHERTEGAVQEEFRKNREETGASARHLREEVRASVQGFADSLSKQLATLTESHEKRLGALREVVDVRLQHIQDESGKKLDEMRATVDEKLQGTLEKRLAESFRQVSERLEAVHQGLGEMQTLATGVGDLKRVLTNVRTRGTWGEIQLGTLLEQSLSAGQYQRNVATRRDSGDRVEFAVRLPGEEADGGEPVWLPIDAKFPQEDFQRLLNAQERGDPEAAERAARDLAARVKLEARRIRDKYLNPPATTDFAIMFLATEGLYAEVLRRPGLAERIQNDYRVTVAGPTVLAALLNSLQLGFRTLAIQRRTSEVWKLLGAVKRNFHQFHELLDKVDRKLGEAARTIGEASRKTRNIESRLQKVEELPAGETRQLLPEPGEDS